MLNDNLISHGTWHMNHGTVCVSYIYSIHTVSTVLIGAFA